MIYSSALDTHPVGYGLEYAEYASPSPEGYMP